MVASCGGHGLLYFMADVSSLLRNYRIAAISERNMGRPQADEGLRLPVRSWQDSASEDLRSCLLDCAFPKAGSCAGHPVAFRLCAKETDNGSELTRLLGWSISALIHTVILTMVVLSNLYITSLRTIPQKEPFRWEVSFMAAPRVEAVVAEGIESQETGAVVESDPGAIVDARSLEQVEAYVRHQDDSVLQEMTTTAVVPRQRTDQEPVSEQFLRETDALKRAAAMPGETSSETVQPPPEVASQHDSNRLQVEAQPESPTVLQRPEILTRELIDRTALPDYGWLTNVLRAKLERVKIYPVSAKANHVQGRVVVQVSIDGDGRIANPEIEESSGYSVLDHAALDALQAASPLTLSHRLDGPPIVMLIPLNYQLE